MGVNPIFVDLVAARYLFLNIDFKTLIVFVERVFLKLNILWYKNEIFVIVDSLVFSVFF